MPGAEHRHGCGHRRQSTERDKRQSDRAARFVGQLAGQKQADARAQNGARSDDEQQLESDRSSFFIEGLLQLERCKIPASPRAPEGRLLIRFDIAATDPVCCTAVTALPFGASLAGCQADLTSCVG